MCTAWLINFFVSTGAYQDESDISPRISIKPSSHSDYSTHRDGDVYVGTDDDGAVPERDRTDSNPWPFYPKDSSREFVFHNPKSYSKRGNDTMTESSHDVDHVPRSHSADSESDVSDETRSSVDDDDMYTVTSNPQVQSLTIF